MSAALTSIQGRLTTASSLLLERERIISLKLAPSASSTAQIVRNLTTLKTDIAKLEDEVELEAAGLAVGGKKRGKSIEGEMEGAVREAGERYDRLVEMLEEDDMGREKAKVLKRIPKITESEVEASDLPSRGATPRLDVNISRTSTPRVHVEPPTPIAPFKDYPEDEDDDLDERDKTDKRTPHEMIAEQQLMMEDQDERLNLLSNSIGRQNHLSIQIGSELDLHHDLLEDTDAAMDRTQARLDKAKRRLDKVAGEAKQYGSTITIVVLIFILLILIIVFKT